MSEYTVPTDEEVGEYSYRCMVTNTVDGASITAVSDEVNVTIVKAEAKIIVEPRVLSLTYNGKSQRLAMNGIAGGGTILYSIDNENWSSNIPSRTNAGTYKLYYMVQGDANHSDVSCEEPIEVSIAKRNLIITVDPKEKKYGEPDPVLTYQVEGLASGDRLTGQLTREAGEDVGTYLISGEGIEPEAYCKGNYNLVPQGNVLIINPADGGGDDPEPSGDDKVDPTPTPTPAPVPETDPNVPVFNKLRLKSTKQTNTSITLLWNKPSKAAKFVVYGNRCDDSNKMEKIGTYTDTSKKLTRVAGKKIQKGKYYKFQIVALDENNNVVSTSKMIHVATKGGKVTNPKSVTVKLNNKTVTAVSVKKGETVTVKSSVSKASKKLKLKEHRAVKYESSNEEIATVTSKGKIKGIKKGTCYIYAYAQNGVYKKIKVTVK